MRGDMLTEENHGELTRSGLNLIQQAISIFDADLRLAVCNRPYQAMFALPGRHFMVRSAKPVAVRSRATAKAIR